VVAVLELALDVVLGVLAVELLVVVVVLVLELPHAASPNASTAQPASALILFLITASPLAGLSFDGAWSTRLSAYPACQDTVFSTAGGLGVNKS
jgi:hypothetical protein